jgi:multiple sugar transport system substrate-binding protein
MRTLPRRVIAAAPLIALVLAACPAPREYTDPSALVLATYSDFTDEATALTAGWRAAHPDVSVSLMPLRPADFEQAVYPRLLTGAHVPDVLFVDAGFLARFGYGPLLADLAAPPFAAGPLLSDLPPSAVAQGTARGRLVGVAADLAPMALYYRKDVLDRAGVAESDLTGSWEKFVEACGRVQAGAGAACISWEAELFDWVLRSGLASGESPFLSAAGVPFPDDARLARAFELARRASEAHIASYMPAGSEDWVDALRRGRIAVVDGGPAFVRQLAALAPRTRGQWRSAPLPGGAAIPGPSMFCVLSEKGARKALAWELVRGACLSKDAQLAVWEQAGALPALRAAAADPRIDAPLPFLGGQGIGPAWRAAAGALPVVPFGRMDMAATDALSRELDRVLHQQKPIEQALADARATFVRRLEREKR